MPFHVYMLASYKRGTLYIGVTNNLARRAWEHKKGTHNGFTKKYGVKRLVYAEEYQNVSDAIEREKKLKKWKRQYKIELIESVNPEWEDYYDSLI